MAESGSIRGSRANLESKLLHLLGLGSKTTQAKDIRYAERVVDALRKESGE